MFLIYTLKGCLHVKLFNPNNALILSGHRALYRSVPKSVKGIYAKIEDETLIWKIYFDEALTDHNKELLDEALTQIVSDFPNVTSIEEEYTYCPGALDFSNTFYHE